MSVVPGSRAVLEFEQIACLPDRADNAAIALRTIEPGERVLLRHIVYEFTHTVLEGHWFAIYRIEKGGLIRSWGKPFGIALRPIEPGEYLANNKMLQALNLRKVDAVLPSTPNFQDFTPEFEIEDCQFGAEQVRSEAEGTFMGFHRQSPRGIGTRNFIVLLGTDSLSGAFVQRLSSEFADCPSQYGNIDGVVPVAHTEGGSLKQPLNLELTLRTLAGFAVHPNVGAVLMIDSGGGSSVSNQALQEYCRKHSYPLDAVVHEIHSRTGKNDEGHCRKVVRRWFNQVNQFEREKVPFSGLKIGLQCGGSDAFSGITANPVLGMLAQETVARGGNANLAETDELIGAENYVLERVRDLQTAERFLAKVERFKKWAALHGHSAEGNPSGGNLFRGLYNITLKSLGAARKKSAATRLDYVIDFAEQMSEPGFYFMDSPGNDLESIAGQVAAGCNLILFATGNGSITNFPFVPTLKVMTTTGRFEQLKNEMDFDAGRLLTGESLEKVADDAFGEVLEVISGKRTAGEIAGHSQVQLWREWRGGNTAETKPRFTGEPGKSRAEAMNLPGVPKLRTRIGEVKEKAALILPTSLCAGEIARKIAERLNQRIEKERLPFSRAVTLPHTEGCGNSGGESEELFIRTMVGYLTHPLVGRALLLEHGCEKTHNDSFRNALRKLGIPEEQFGWCGIQSDGGIESTVRKALKWFEVEAQKPANEIGLLQEKKAFSMGIFGAELSSEAIEILRMIAVHVVRFGGAVIVPHTVELWPGLNLNGISLDYGERFRGEGIFTMYCPTDDYLEILTGLGASGVEAVLHFSSGAGKPGNPLIPTMQLTQNMEASGDKDIAFVTTENKASVAERILLLMASIRAGIEKPNSWKTRNCGFQITRGYTGISL